MEQYVKITLDEYKSLVKSACEMEALQAVGVDNWGGWGEHRDTYKDLATEALSEENINKVLIRE